MDRDNRKSHLAPQLSPATQDLLRSSDSPNSLNQADDRTMKTPTSGEIPIMGHTVSHRDQYGSISSRSPTRRAALGSISRPGRSAVHSGLGSRVASPNNNNSNNPNNPNNPNNSIHPGERQPRHAPANHSASPSHSRRPSKTPSLSLPVRPAPPARPPPPPLARRNTPDDIKEKRRQVTINPHLSGI